MTASRSQQMAESMLAMTELPPVTLDHINALIQWVETGKQPDTAVVSRGHLLKALMELRLRKLTE